MALVQCPECKQEISDQATACPHCGAPRSKAAAPAVPPTPRPATRSVRPILLIGLLVFLAFVVYRLSRPALERAGVVASARFAIDNGGGNEECTVLGDYCLRVHCAVTNIGDADGIARLAADLVEDNSVVATHHATSRLLVPGQHDTLTLDFPEATLASKEHRFRCYPEP